MYISQNLKERSNNLCELCTANEAVQGYTLSPKTEDAIENQVALCNTCVEEMKNSTASFYWRCLEGSIWNPEPAVQALCYRILQPYKTETWVESLLNTVDLDEAVIEWGISALAVADVHKDAFGNILESGDNVVLTQALNVKGTNFTAAKGTVVKRIKLVHDNHEQIEGKINDQVIVILCKFVKKG